MAMCARSPITLRVMSFNIWVGGSGGGQPLEQTARVIRESGACIVGMQETHADETDNSAAIAEILGWHHCQQGGATAVLSKYPITGHTTRKWGVYVKIADQVTVCVFNVHFAPSPYQPYQLLGVAYGNAPFIETEKEAIEWAETSRGGQVLRMLDEVDEARQRGCPIFITGDFNEPSFLDWTERAAEEGVHPIAVAFPATHRITRQGFVDTYRAVHGDELRRPGFTWTPLSKPDDPADHHDRIDYVFAARRGVVIEACRVVGESKKYAEIVVNPWPSDHRAVVATVQVSR